MKRLDEIEARANAATEGPWEVEHHLHCQTRDQVVSEIHPIVECEGNGSGGVYRGEDAEFIAASRADVPALVAALQAVLEVHRYDEFVMEAEGRAVCSECWGRDADILVAWPCLTVETIHQYLGGDA